ncbi:MAG: nucleotidyl transferase AbiEii/AbiGii toxin family protein [Gemmataceae bacterium]|nr:nucleotidyl transferase AbiEii/AbiGii toxin family protein [Gemmataceae bacterium]
MPLTPLQSQVLSLLAVHRTPESHVAGGAAINRGGQSPRYSSDLDFFHDTAEVVRICAERDADVLERNGYQVTWLLRNPYLWQARIRKDDEAIGLDWCHDSVFRFFPVLADPEFGYCLHPIDLATNKMLALAGRSKIRDYIDILYLHETVLSLGALCWAACGKDPGFNPVSLLEMAKRHTAYQEAELAAERLTRPLKLADLKLIWIQAADDAEALFKRLPAKDIGCLYLDAAGKPVTPDPASAECPNLIRHFGSVRGAWPRLTEQS